MFKNYLKISIRNLWKNKAASSINILGLTIGLCSCLLIGIYISHETTYDNFEQNGDRIVRVIMGYRFNGGGEEKKGNFTSARVAPVFTQTFPEISAAVRMTLEKEVVKYGDKLITEKKFMYADPSFFDIFSFSLLQGNPKNALAAPGQVILTKSAARRYFAGEEPLGKTITVGTDNKVYQVTGVLPDCPSNSQIKFDFLASWSSLGLTNQESNYWNANYTTYFLLKDKNSIGSLQAKIAPFMEKEMRDGGATVNFYLEPFQRIHLHSEYDGFEPTNNIRYIYILEIVALLILLIACFTYINLNTARSLERAKEVGIRKVIGAEKKQLFWQFIGESAILCVFAMVISFVIAILVLPAFNQLTEKQLTTTSLFSFPVIAGAILVTLLVSLMAGSYPALVLANFQPIRVLKGSFKNTESGQWMRKSLIVFQFAISVVLIVSTFIMQKQLQYIQSKDVGYTREQVLVFPMDEKMNSNLELIKRQLTSNTNILSVSACRNTPVKIRSGYNMRSGSMPEDAQIAVTANGVDEDFIKTTGLHIIAGTDLTQQDLKDVSYELTNQSVKEDFEKNIFHFVLNESAAKELGWTPEQAIGKRMYLDATRPGYVKAVVKDFNFESLHLPIKPVVLFPTLNGTRLLIKIKGNNIPESISFLQSKWKELVANRPFEYSFLDDDFNQLYSSDLRLGNVLNIFAFIAIVLACMGLLGLSAYAAKQRVKEIAIRKILGATVQNISLLLTVDFIKLVLVAIVIASPFAWLVMNKWLTNFAYRIQISWWMVAISGIFVATLAALTVSFQAIRSARINPVRNLKNE